MEGVGGADGEGDGIGAGVEGPELPPEPFTTAYRMAR